MKLNLSDLQDKLPITLEYFDSIDSTSLYLKRCMKERIRIPGVVIAGFQTNGQGRSGKSFFSPKQTGLYLTFVMKKEEFDCCDITSRIAIAVSSAIDEVFFTKTGIKWVNDIYLDSKKVSGVLCQSVDGYYLIGIGINVENPGQIPEELSGRFGYICEKCDPEKYNLLVLSLYKNIVDAAKLSNEKALCIFREKCVHFNQVISIEQNGELLEGLCLGIDDEFALIVNIKGKIYHFTSGFMTIKI